MRHFHCDKNKKMKKKQDKRYKRNFKKGMKEFLINLDKV